MAQPDFENMTEDEILAALETSIDGGNLDGEQTKETETETVVSAGAGAKAPDQQEEPKGATEPPEPATEPVRIRVSGADAFYHSLVKEGVDRSIAFARAYGEQVKTATTQAEEQTQVQQQTQQQTEPDDALATLEAELAEVTASNDARAEAYEANSPESLRDQRREQELRLQVNQQKALKSQRDAEATKAADAQWDKTWSESEAEAVSLYPQLADPKSALAMEVAKEIEKIVKTPNHRFAGQADIPMLVAPIVAARLRVAASPPTTQQSSKTFPAPGGSRGTTVSGNQEAQRSADTRQRVETAVANDDPEAIARVLAEQLGDDTPGKFSMQID